jgi:protein-L-isoaspartate(D-aspartate) O-methyltransferase
MSRRRRRDTAAQVEAARRVGVHDPRVLAAVAAVPRDHFVPVEARSQAHEDRPISIGAGQTTSQPSLIAAMLEALALTGTERVLEVGTGFGYQTALLAHLAAEVYSIERIAPLADQARDNLASIGITGVEVVVGDGTRGLPEHAPYDAIVVSAATLAVPRSLADQLVEGGRLVAPVGPDAWQEAVLFTRVGGELERSRRLTAVRFVPLIADEPPRGAGAP